MASQSEVVLGEGTLTSEAVGAIVFGGAVAAITDDTRKRIQRSRDVVDGLLADAAPAYGITTGVGSQKDFEVTEFEAAEYARRLITAHGTRVPGGSLPATSVRAAMIFVANMLATGNSGVSVELVDLLVDKINEGVVPEIDQHGSVGASDLVPLAQIGHWLLDSTEARAGRLPRSKEPLSLINNDAMSVGSAALVVPQVGRLLEHFDLSLAMALEGFRGNVSVISAQVNAVHRRSGQAAVSDRVRGYLAGSAILDQANARLLQDPLSFRCAPQIHGAADETLSRAREVVDSELNTVHDNPIVDVERRVAVSHGNMDTTRLTLALDGLRQAVAKVCDVAGERIHKIQWPAFTDLSTGLAAEPGAIGGVQFLNLGHIAGAVIGTIKSLAHPVLLTSVGQLADGVEDTASFALHSVTSLEDMTEHAYTVLAIEMITSCWAIHVRGIDRDDLGASVRRAYDLILPLLPIGTEGNEPFDIGTVVDAIRSDL